MKSIALVVLGAMLGIGLMLFVPHGAPQVVYADPPSGNGDVNGSGKIDLADAIYLLGYLFANGPAPETIECDSCCPPVCPPRRLPATGQTTCYDTEGNVINCGSAEWPGQDGFYQTGCPTVGRFTDNGDGTVTDNCTGLMWQQDTVDVNGDGTIVWDQDVLTWQDALLYCESLEFAGHDDWRLPNVRELQSIVDYGRGRPAIDPVFGAESDWYWSSSTSVLSYHYAWLVHFVVGSVDITIAGKDHPCSVRAVRDAD